MQILNDNGTWLFICCVKWNYNHYLPCKTTLRPLSAMYEGTLSFINNYNVVTLIIIFILHWYTHTHVIVNYLTFLFFIFSFGFCGNDMGTSMLFFEFKKTEEGKWSYIRNGEENIVLLCTKWHFIHSVVQKKKETISRRVVQVS